MSDPKSESAIIVPNINSQGYIQLPFNEEGFKEFITGLLGKPQTINARLSGNFNITKENIFNIISLLEQRLTQQNDAYKLQFNARIVFEDESSVLLNSYEDFVSYNEIRNIQSTELHISLTYLIKFLDKNVPEKQEINFSFVTTNKKKSFKKIINTTFYPIVSRNNDEDFFQGYIQYEIKHTARTWASDIANLLSQNFEQLIESETKFRIFVRTYSGILSLISSLLTSLTGFCFVKSAIDQYKRERLLVIENLFKDKSITLKNISQQVKFIATDSVTKIDDMFLVFFISFFCFMFSLLFYSSLFESSPKSSFLLLTQKSQKSKILADHKYSRRTSVIIGSMIVNIILSIISSYLYDKIKI